MPDPAFEIVFLILGVIAASVIILTILGVLFHFAIFGAVLGLIAKRAGRSDLAVSVSSRVTHCGHCNSTISSQQGECPNCGAPVARRAADG